MSATEPTMTDRLTAEDAALLLPAMREAEAATAALQQAIAANNAAQGALAYITRHLEPKYGLCNGDHIAADGTITRKENSGG
jgi:hypothetical protein